MINPQKFTRFWIQRADYRQHFHDIVRSAFDETRKTFHLTAAKKIKVERDEHARRADAMEQRLECAVGYLDAEPDVLELLAPVATEDSTE